MNRIIIFTLLLLILLSSTISAHPGRTDGSGGHNGPDGYHYHHGHPAHDHTDLDGDGELDCPYGYKNNTKDKSSTSSAKNKITSNKNGHNSFYIKHTSLHILTIISLSIMIVVFIIAIICKIKYDDPITANLYGAGIAALSGILALNAYHLPSLLTVICYLAIMLGSLPLLLIIFFLTPMYIENFIDNRKKYKYNIKEKKKQEKTKCKPKKHISTGAMLIILSLILWIVPIVVLFLPSATSDVLGFAFISLTLGSIIGLIGIKTV